MRERKNQAKERNKACKNKRREKSVRHLNQIFEQGIFSILRREGKRSRATDLVVVPSLPTDSTQGVPGSRRLFAWAQYGDFTQAKPLSFTPGNNGILWIKTEK
ncbi:hypothetical protein AAMO2058_001261600 [Amorphochlora amoebiformis]